MMDDEMLNDNDGPLWMYDREVYDAVEANREEDPFTVLK
jgi:hypothetical protein